GVNTPRAALSGRPLPGARRVSFTVHPEGFVRAPKWTHLLTQFGQFLTHDISFAQPPFFQTLGLPPSNCCEEPYRSSSPKCIPIFVPRDDPFYKTFNVSCLVLERNLPCFRCRLGFREQENSRTSYIDGSTVYGISKEQTDALRSFSMGKSFLSLLKTQRINDAELPPPSFEPEYDDCSIPNKTLLCFQTGDPRANQHPLLTSVQIIWLRQHNRVARQLHAINPHWNDEMLFQVAKRIVESQIQHVTYSEWLPEAVDVRTRVKHELNSLKNGYTRYDPTVDATVSNEFTTAAFRFGHANVNGTFLLLARVAAWEPRVKLKDKYFDPFDFYKGILPRFVGGMMAQPQKAYSRFGDYGVTRFFGKNRNSSFGGDLFAIDIQRGRDHGIRGYADYVKYCHGIKLRRFVDLYAYGLMSNDNARLYSKIYKDVRDIDFFSAGISEYPVPGAIAGPTFSCILAGMFHKLKYGDRFFYEHQRQAGSFT
ncbi:unnamed protein product, partial [Ixodes hexagonus]